MNDVFSPIYRADLLEQAAILAFYGFGYNFYSTNNQLRKDDELVRRRSSDLLGRARDSIRQAESQYRRKNLRPPTREHPDPDPAALEAVRTIAELSGLVQGIETVIRSAPMPGNDLMLARFRSQTELLMQLRTQDSRVIGAVHVVADRLDQCTAEWLVEHESEVRRALGEVAKLSQQRSDLLSIIK